MDSEIIIEALGISLGDVLITSYGSGPFEVKSIRQPRRFEITSSHIIIRDHEVTSFVLRDLDGKSTTDSYINNVRRTGERWATDQNDEIFVEKKHRRNIVQLGLFDERRRPAAEEYEFQPGCDYRAGAGRVWHCPRCRKDFDTAEKHKLPYWCPACKDVKFMPVCVPIFYVEAPPVGDWRARPSEYMMTLNMEDYLPYDKTSRTLIKNIG